MYNECSEGIIWYISALKNQAVQIEVVGMDYIMEEASERLVKFFRTFIMPFPKCMVEVLWKVDCSVVSETMLSIWYASMTVTYVHDF